MNVHSVIQLPKFSSVYSVSDTIYSRSYESSDLKKWGEGKQKEKKHLNSPSLRGVEEQTINK